MTTAPEMPSVEISTKLDLSDLGALSLAQLHTAFCARTLTPEHYLDFCLAQIRAKNPSVHAVLDIYADTAKTEAIAATQRYAEGRPLSQIDGIPVAIKANIAVKGRVRHGGIKAYAADIAPDDAACVARLKAAGAVILCSVNMEEGALGAVTDNPFFGRTTNPLNPALTAGGSSGGSAAAVAAGMVPIALGTDTMGSVRIPSAYCGLVGHKPSKDLVPFDGVMPLSPTLDHVGPHCRSVDDVRRVLAVMAETSLDTQTPIEDLVIGHLVWPEDMDVLGDIQKQFMAVITQLNATVSATMPIRFDGYDFGKTRRAGLLVSEYEGHGSHAQKLADNPDGFSNHFRTLLEWGARQSKDKVSTSYALIAAQTQRADTIFNACDVLLMPTTLQVAFGFDDPIPANQADFTAFANFAGLPATAVPMGMSGTGLPMSVQVIGPRGADGLTLSVAEQVAALLTPTV